MYNSPDAISTLDHTTDDVSNPVEDNETTTAEPEHASAGLNAEKWHKTPRARGRQPKDPHAQVVRFDCHDADDMETYLRNYLDEPSAPAEHATIEFHFPSTAAFMVYSKDFKKDHPKPPPGMDANVYEALKRTAVSVMEVLSTTETTKDQMRRQKSVAKICVETLQRADGYRYSFHNSWLSREDEAYRFSFFCNDSTLNKGRAANEGAGSNGKTKRKAVYDCQGLISVKLSATKQNLEVHYRHIPIHKTYVERAPPPRRDSKRRKLMEIFNPDSLTPLRAPPQRRKVDGKNLNMVRHKRRATDPLAPESSVDPTIDITQDSEGSLQPLIDFLGSAERQGSQTPLSSGTGAMSRNVTTSEPPELPAQTSQKIQTTSSEPVTGKSKKNPVPPNIPGAMFGNIRSGSISWGTAGSTSKQKQVQDPRENATVKPTSQNRTKKSTKKTTAQEKSQPAVEPTPSTTSELEMLKQKLLEAEERIKRLESQPQQAQQFPSSQPPYPPPWGYPPVPPNSQYSHPHAPAVVAQQQVQHPYHSAAIPIQFNPSLPTPSTPTEPPPQNQSNPQQDPHQAQGVAGVLKPASTPSNSGPRGRGSFISWKPKEPQGKGSRGRGVGVAARNTNGGTAGRGTSGNAEGSNDIPSKFV